MIAGSATRSTMGDTLADQAISYECHGLDDPDPLQAESYTLPQQNCPQGFYQVVFFPSCWNGRDITSANFQDHVIYPVGTFGRFQGGTCPPTHPVRLMTIKLEQNIHSELFEYYDGAFILATGDNEGYSSHADFTNGWDNSENSLLQRAINTCTDNQDRMSECSVLSSTVNSDYHLCRPESNIPVEDVGIYGGLTKLPGDNPIWGGSVPKVLTGVSNSPPFGSPYTTLPSNWVYYGCINGGAPTLQF